MLGSAKGKVELKSADLSKKLIFKGGTANTYSEFKGYSAMVFDAIKGEGSI
jgi:hypothetical protein